MRTLIAPLLMLALWLCALASSSAASSLQLGENWLAPAGNQTVQQDLSAYGGAVYQAYVDEPTTDGAPNRIRLLRYPWRSVTQAQVAAMQTKGLTWLLANEVSNSLQDGGMLAGQDATPFVQWMHTQAANIRSADPTARIAGPSVIGWTPVFGITPGRDVYDRLWSVHQQLYGSPPDLQIVNLHYYPSGNWFYNLPWAEKQMVGEVNAAADWAASKGLSLGLSEWSYWYTNFDATCTPHPQTDAERSHYVQTGLQAMAARGVLWALWFGNVSAPCNSDGHTAFLFDSNGALTVEGRAFRDFAQGAPVPTATLAPTPTMLPTPTITVQATPSATPTPNQIVRTPTDAVPTPSLTATSLSIATLTPTLPATSTRTSTPTPSTTVLVPTPVPSATPTPPKPPSVTPTPTRAGTPCVPNFLRKCGP